MGGLLVEQTNVIINKLRPDAQLPEYATDEAAGADLRACFDGEAIAIEVGKRAMIPTGLAMEMLPGFEAQCRPRSGLAARFGLTILNAPGTVDSDYRGELMVILHNAGEKTYYVNSGDRIAQLVFAPVVHAAFIEGELSQSNRGEGGFGSTGIA
jgi:dUTP pyrophosphatase